MGAKREFRDRPAVEVAVLDALVERGRDGMTVFEVRAAVDDDIDAIEDALAALNDDGLIDVEERTGGGVVILPAERVVPDPDDVPGDRSVFDEVRDRLGL